MPTYDYKCEKCDHTFEENLKIAHRKIPTESPCERQLHRAAPVCGGEVKQIIVKAAGFAYDNIPSPGHPKKPPGWFSDKIKDMKNRFPGNTL